MKQKVAYIDYLAHKTVLTSCSVDVFCLTPLSDMTFSIGGRTKAWKTIYVNIYQSVNSAATLRRESNLLTDPLL